MRAIRLMLVGLTSLVLAGCGDLDGIFDDLTSSSGDISIPGTGGGGSRKVAVILPLSGRLAAVGGEMRNAINLAIQDTGGATEVQFFDSAGTSGGAQSAGAQAASYGAGIVLGPLLGTNINSVRAGLGDSPAPLLAFSNDVTKAGGNNFVFGLTPANSARRILQYAAAQGKRNIGILYPSNDYGQAAQAAAVAMAPSLGIRIVSSRSYSASAGREGAASRQAAANAMGAQRGAIDGLFIPDGGGRLREIASLAFFYRIDPRSDQYLGTQLMDDASLSSEPALNGARFSAIQGSVSQFESRFASAHGNTPRPVSAVAYDAMALAAGLQRSGQSFSAAALTNRNGFRGVMGAYRINGGGTTERLMAVKQLGSSGISVVQSAGSSFVF